MICVLPIFALLVTVDERRKYRANFYFLFSFQAGGAGAVVTGYENILDVWSASFAAVGTIPNLRTKDIRLNFQVLFVCVHVILHYWI